MSEINREALLPVPDNTPEEDAKENKKKAIREVVLVGGVLFLIFVVFLPQFIDYGQVIDSMLKLSISEILLLSAFGVMFTWFSAGVYNTLIPGLGWWEGWKAWAASNSVAFLAPPGADVAIRFGMYRTAGIDGEAAGAGLDEPVLRARVEAVFSLYKFGMEHHISLLSPVSNQIGKPFPRHQVLCARKTCSCHGAAGIPLRCVGILALSAEDTIDISIFMSGKPQVIYIGIRIIGFGHGQRAFPEPEIIHPIGTLGNGKK